MLQLANVGVKAEFTSAFSMCYIHIPNLVVHKLLPILPPNVFFPWEAPVYLLHSTSYFNVVSCGSQFFSCSVVVLLLAACHSLILQLQLVGQTRQARMGEFSDTNFEIGKTLRMFQLNVSVIIDG